MWFRALGAAASAAWYLHAECFEVRCTLGEAYALEVAHWARTVRGTKWAAMARVRGGAFPHLSKAAWQEGPPLGWPSLKDAEDFAQRCPDWRSNRAAAVSFVRAEAQRWQRLELQIRGACWDCSLRGHWAGAAACPVAKKTETNQSCISKEPPRHA